MALTNCPECSKEVSEKAMACPNCGHPLDSNAIVPTNTNELMEYPQLPNDLSIGKMIVNWGGDSAFEGTFEKDENVIEQIPSGKIKMILHTHGIRVASGSYLPLVDIHNSQIISIKQTTKAELINMDKSVVGRAVVGGLILGPLGAVIGGMSGIGSKQIIKDKSFLIINYWDTKSKSAQTLLIGGDKTKIQIFVNRNLKEININQTQNRQAESSKKGCLGLILIPIGLTITYFLLR